MSPARGTGHVGVRYERPGGFVVAWRPGTLGPFTVKLSSHRTRELAELELARLEDSPAALDAALELVRSRSRRPTGGGVVPPYPRELES